MERLYSVVAAATPNSKIDTALTEYGNSARAG